MFELISSLGLGPQLTIAASLLLGGFYLYRAAALASLLTAVLGSAVTYVLVVLLAAAGAIAAGWVDPHPGVLVGHAAEATAAASEHGTDVVRRGFEIVRKIVPV